MLIKVSYKDKKESIYKCDLCKEKLNGETVLKLYVQRNRKFIFLYDLCENCLNKVEKRKW